MIKYYTRACNFYHGTQAKSLIIKNLALPLCGNNNIAFSKIEIFKSNNKKISSKIIDINKTVVVVEQVNAMPGQGVTSMFNFGQTFGAIKGISATLKLPIFFVRPSKWKKHFELINSSKDASRTKVIEMYPSFAEQLSRKKDVNKSDAILIARFFSETGFKDDLK